MYMLETRVCNQKYFTIGLENDTDYTVSLKHHHAYSGLIRRITKTITPHTKAELVVAEKNGSSSEGYADFMVDQDTIRFSWKNPLRDVPTYSLKNISHGHKKFRVEETNCSIGMNNTHQHAYSGTDNHTITNKHTILAQQVKSFLVFLLRLKYQQSI